MSFLVTRGMRWGPARSLVFALFAVGAHGSAAAQGTVDVALLSTPTADGEAARVVGAQRVQALVAERIAETLGRAVQDTHVELTGSTPPAVDSVDVTRGSGRWIVTFYVDGARVRRFARAGRLGPVPVAARPVSRGAVLAPEDVRIERRIAWDDGDEAPEDVIGLVAQRVLTEGEPLTAPAVRPPYLVRGGDPVQAVFRRAGIVMTLRSEALGTARKGDHVRVQLPSGVRMGGTVVGPGLVELNEGGGR